MKSKPNTYVRIEMRSNERAEFDVTFPLWQRLLIFLGIKKIHMTLTFDRVEGRDMPRIGFSAK